MNVASPADLGRRRRRPSGEPPPLPVVINHAAVGWLVAFGSFAVLWIWIFLSDAPAIWLTERDLELMSPIVDGRTDWLTPIMQTVNDVATHWITPVVGWITLLVAIVMRRIRHALVLIAALSIVAGIVTVVSVEIGRPRPLGVSRIGDWDGYAQPSRPIALATTALIAAALTIVPGRWRRPYYWAAGVLVTTMGAAQVYVGVDHPTDVLGAATLGVAVPLVLYRTIAPEIVFPITYDDSNPAHLDVSGPRGEAIRAALRSQLDLDIERITPIGLESSAGSTPLRLDGTDGSRYFAKLYAHNHLRSDRSYKLWRTLVYGRLEDEQRFTSVLRLIEHEDYMLHVLRRVGVPGPQPLGVVEITPDREYVLVTEFLTGATEIGGSEVTVETVDEALDIVVALWGAGLAHRDIKPANVMVQDGHPLLVDVSFAQVRPSPWRQAVDLANMMLVLALRCSPSLVYERARTRFSDAEIAEAFAACRGVTLPTQLRRAIRRDGRDLAAEFRAMVPPRRPVSIQRWSARRIGLMSWVASITLFVAIIFVANLADIGLR